MRRRGEDTVKLRTRTPGCVTHKQKIKYNCRNSPQRARLPNYIGLPSLGVLLWKDELPKCIVLKASWA